MTLHLLLVGQCHENAVKWNFGVRIIGKKEGNGQARASRPVELIAAAAVTACSKEEPSTNEEVEQQTENMEPHRTFPVVVTSLSRKAQMYL